MLNLHMTSVPSDKVSALKAIAAKQPDYYHGHVRQFLTRDGEIFCIDTRYDDELAQAGLLEETPDTDHSPKED